jgi:hypothetical protein
MKQQICVHVVGWVPPPVRTLTWYERHDTNLILQPNHPEIPNTRSLGLPDPPRILVCTTILYYTLALEFGLHCMIRQPCADTHVIWVARHKVTRPQTILKFRPPSSLNYRTRNGSQSGPLYSITLWLESSQNNVMWNSKLLFSRSVNRSSSTWLLKIERVRCIYIYISFV